MLDKRRGRLTQMTSVNAFVEGHLYTTTNEAGEKSDQIERAFAIMEGIVEPILAHVVADVRKRLRPNLSANEREWLLAFSELQFKRTPQTLASVVANTQIENLLANAVADYEAQYGPITHEARANAFDPERVARMSQNILMQNLLRFDGPAHDAIQKRGIAFARIVSPGKQFILGSRPFARFSSERRSMHLDDLGSELWLPIAPDLALGSHGRAPTMKYIQLDGAGTRKINEEIFVASDVVASSSRELVSALGKRFGVRGL